MNISRIHKLFRSYIFHSPIRRGKYRLSDLALRLSPQESGVIEAIARDGRKLSFNSKNEGYRYLYFVGEYEPAITGIFRELVAPGNVCLDIGANMGWFTTLFQMLVGNSGSVHAFEPVPAIFEFLTHNVRLNEPPRNVRLNNLALGDTEKEVELHIFRDLPDGHASIATFGHKDYDSVACKMITLDRYLSDNMIENVRIVKMDIEGAEMTMLKGASKLFEQKHLPVLEVEMALATTRGFGYLPNDLIEYIRGQGDYNFFEIDERNYALRQIHGFGPDDIGANVLCLPRDFAVERLAKWFD